jgi:hypothetical protein
MGSTTPIHFAINSYKAKSGLVSAERAVNCRAEITPETSPFRSLLSGTEGLTVWKDTGVSLPIYGMRVMGENLYVVAGNYVFKIDSTKTQTTLGTIASSPDRVMMTDNGTQVTILNAGGTAHYCTSTAASLTQITDGQYELSDSVTNLDGYSVFTKQQSRTFQFSDLNDTSVYALSDKQTVEANSSNIVRVAMNNLELWFFKEDIIQVYYNSARPGYIFDRKDGVFIQKGCAAKHSVATLDNAFYFLGDDRIIYRTIGYRLEAISTFPISQEIQGYSTVSDAFGFTYVEGGHKIYAITFPTANTTWEYDITTGIWNERSSINSAQVSGRWRANCHVFFNGKNLVGDFETGIIYEIDPDVYTENGTRILRKAIGTTIFKDFARVTASRFVIMMDTGVGIATGQGSDPQLMLRTSLNGGKTWSDELWKSVGAIGSYLTEVHWGQLGQSRSFIMELTYSEPTKFNIVGAFINLEEGYS